MEAMLRSIETQKSEPRLGDQVETLARDVKQLGRLAGTRAGQKLRAVQDRGERLYGQLRSKSREVVERRPLLSLATAAGLGALAAAGLMLSKKS